MSKIRYCSYESADVKLEIAENGSRLVGITNLFARERQKGHARKLMEQVCAWADDNEKILVLVVGQYGHPIGPDNDILKAFYSSLGFVDNEKAVKPNSMVRYLAEKTSPITTHLERMTP